MSVKLKFGRLSMLFKDAYSPSLTYHPLDVVTYENNSYICKKGTTAGISPDNTEYWGVIAKSITGPQGPAGEAGPQGPAGPKGDTFSFDDLTEEQKAELKGTFDPEMLEEYAKKTDVSAAIDALVGSAPGTLDTIYEIAELLQSNDTSIGALFEEIALKANKDDVYDKDYMEENFLSHDALDDKLIPGPEGPEGKSAYEVYVNSLDDPEQALPEDEWLESLKAPLPTIGKAEGSDNDADIYWYINNEQTEYRAFPKVVSMTEQDYADLEKKEEGTLYVISDSLFNRTNDIIYQIGNVQAGATVEDISVKLRREGNYIYFDFIIPVANIDFDALTEAQLNILRGKSNYDIYKENHVETPDDPLLTETEWLESINIKGDSAYDIYVKDYYKENGSNDGVLSEEDWLRSLAPSIEGDGTNFYWHIMGKNSGYKAMPEIVTLTEQEYEDLGDEVDPDIIYIITNDVQTDSFTFSVGNVSVAPSMDGAEVLMRRVDSSYYFDFVLPGLLFDDIPEEQLEKFKPKSAYDIYVEELRKADPSILDSSILGQTAWVESLKGLSAYDVYVEQEKLYETPDASILSKVEWLNSLKVKGDKGDLADISISEDGYWIINGTVTGAYSKGADASLIITEGIYTDPSSGEETTGLTWWNDGVDTHIPVNMVSGGGDKKGGFNVIINTATEKHGLVNSLTKNYNPSIGEGAVIEGDGSDTNLIEALGKYSHAEGYSTIAYEDYSHVEGYQTKAYGYESHAEGYSTIAAGYAAHAEGNNTSAGGYSSHSEGAQTKAEGYASHSEGYNTFANNYAHAEGYNTSAGPYSHAEGYESSTNGDYGHAEGYRTFAEMYGHAEGYNTSTGKYGHAEGYETYAVNEGAHVEGYYNKVYAKYAHGEGRNTTVTGDADAGHAEGYYTTVNAAQGHAEGYYTTVNAPYGHAEGYYTVVTQPAYGSHAEGYQSQTLSSYAHSEGYNTSAGGTGAHAEGGYTKTQSNYEHASGYYNISLKPEEGTDKSQTTVFTVGNGLDDDNRHNALQIMQNGEIYIADTTKSGEAHELPMIKLQDALSNSNVDLSDYYTKSETDDLLAFKLYRSSDTSVGIVSVLNTQSQQNMGNFGLSLGQNTRAYGNYSTALGLNSITKGEYAFATGYYVNSNGRNSFAAGSNIDSNNNSEVAFGIYNISNKANSNFGNAENTLFSIGNGLYTGTVSKHNAIEIRQNGDIYITDTNSSNAFYEMPMIHLQQKLASLASKEDISTAIDNLVNGATDAMDTLSELETAINSNKGILETLNEAIVKKADKDEVETLNDAIVKKADKDEVDQKLAELEENIKVQVYADEVLISAEDSSTLMEYLDDTEKVIAAALTDLNSRLEEIESLKEEVKELAETVQNLQNGTSGEAAATDTYFTGCNKSTEINNIPVSKHFTTVTISESGTFQLEADPEVGRELHIIIKNTSTGAINVQLPENYSGINEGSEIIIEANAFVDMNLIYDGETYYIKAMTE